MGYEKSHQSRRSKSNCNIKIIICLNLWLIRPACIAMQSIAGRLKKYPPVKAMRFKHCGQVQKTTLLGGFFVCLPHLFGLWYTNGYEKYNSIFNIKRCGRLLYS